MKNLLSDQRGMGLSTKIALIFGGLVALVFIVGIIAYFVS